MRASREPLLPEVWSLEWMGLVPLVRLPAVQVLAGWQPESRLAPVAREALPPPALLPSAARVQASPLVRWQPAGSGAAGAVPAE
ncbi:hypothetical protein P24_17498 [Oceanibaculum indicum P24]|uniref:Uncharacterized protein n=1 Tax=Oceanibaculum indicum P24 TaxID=1207063 RepID=K2IZX2_9PROT|nr:hypothetical protein P24_17498 [Oceanibaculum indicum P24]